MSVSASLELHYYLNNQSHSFDAIARNKCEAELLALFHSVAEMLDIKIDIEAQALEEGGLREIWKWIGDDEKQLSFILAIIAIVISIWPDSKNENERLQEELTRLDIEKRKIEIKKLHHEVDKAKQHENPRSDSLEEDQIKLILSDPRVVVHRSNFYKTLNAQHQVTDISITPYDAEGTPTYRERKISRQDFERFILNTQSLQPEINDSATIEIVKPVLSKGNYKWQGIYKKKLISFSMDDHLFIDKVIREEVTFQHGTFIDCVLQINQKLDMVRGGVISNYIVQIVHRKYDDSQSISISQAKRYTNKKKQKTGQKDLFSE